LPTKAKGEPNQAHSLQGPRDLDIGGLWNSDGNVQNDPLAILEWKGGAGSSRKSAVRDERADDIDYLSWAAKEHAVEGYSVAVERAKTGWSIHVMRFLADGTTQTDWFVGLAFAQT
jgi:hypothetical protein